MDEKTRSSESIDEYPEQKNYILIPQCKWLDRREYDRENQRTC